MIIREAVPGDVPQIVRIFFETIHRVNTRDYTAAQVAAWAPAVPDAEAWAARKLPTRTTFVADDDGVIAGFGELEPSGHIDCFYCRHDYQRRGVGSAILARIEERARSLGAARLFAEVSITAHPFFEARGFSVVRQQTVVRRGVELTNFVMDKPLPPSSRD